MKGASQFRHLDKSLSRWRSPEQPLQLTEFDKQVALEALCQGQTVIPFWSDTCGGLRQRVHQQLQENLKISSS